MAYRSLVLSLCTMINTSLYCAQFFMNVLNTDWYNQDRLHESSTVTEMFLCTCIWWNRLDKVYFSWSRLHQTFGSKDPWECHCSRFSEFTGANASPPLTSQLNQLGCRILLHSLEKPQVCLWRPYLQTAKQTHAWGHHERVEAGFERVTWSCLFLGFALHDSLFVFAVWSSMS